VLDASPLMSKRGKVDYQSVFDLRNNPTSPKTIANTPPTSIQIDLSVAEPVKNREISELDESYALTPKTKRRIPPARNAIEIALFIHDPSFYYPCDSCKTVTWVLVRQEGSTRQAEQQRP